MKKFTILLACLCSLQHIFAGDFDTTTIETLEITVQYEFGFPQKDTVASTIHFLTPRGVWYVKGLTQDYYSDKYPVILKSINKKLK